MQVQKQPNEWSCLPTAFAIAVGVPVEQLIRQLGHDGSEMLFPGFRKPYCYRSFHVQELIDQLLIWQYAVTEITKLSILESQNSLKTIDINTRKLFKGNRMQYYLDNYQGVLTGGYMGRTPHALAWDGKYRYDPTSGISTLIDNFKTDIFFITTKINKTTFT